MTTPYLSVVFGMDTECDYVLRGFEKSIRNNFELAKKHGLSMELVLLEWMTPSSTKRLKDAIAWPCSDIPVRIITIPISEQAKIPNPHGFKYLEYHAKNIGIRRCYGEFILSTNPDDILSDELISYLAQGKLESGIFYRINRLDTQNDVVYHVHRSNGAFYTNVPNEAHDMCIKGETLPWYPEQLHYNAAGDFILMRSSDWFTLHGHPERPYNSSVDSETVHLAHSNGLKQVVLPYPMYHPNHDRSLNRPYVPEWSDLQPFSKKNGDNWGFKDTVFEEITLVNMQPPAPAAPKVVHAKKGYCRMHRQLGCIPCSKDGEKY
jgi:hypothetical protein